MRILILSLVTALMFLTSPSWSETFDDLVERNGLYYKKFTEVPFTGKLTGQFQGSFKNGRPEDYCQQYHFFLYSWNTQSYKRLSVRENKSIKTFFS